MGTLRAIYCEMKMKHVQSFVLYGAIHLLQAASPFRSCPAHPQPFPCHTQTSSLLLLFKTLTFSCLNSKNNCLFRDCLDTMLVFKMCIFSEPAGIWTSKEFSVRLCLLSEIALSLDDTRVGQYIRK